MNIILQILLTFVATSIMELLWTLYIHNIRDEELIKAGIYNVGIFIVTSFSTIMYMNDKWLIIPALFGAFFGTVISKFFYTKK